jgi:hypothetical protein
MWARFQVLCMPKDGNVPSEYEDASWVPPCLSDDCETFRLAIADGATETSFAGLWARLLTRSYGRHQQFLDALDSRLSRIRDVWKKCVMKRPLPWYAEAKVNMGAFSSLLGLTVTKTRSANDCAGDWTALAVGDSCLFQIRGDACLLAFPLETADAFSSRPSLLSSIGNSSSDDCPIFTKAGSWRIGDVFYLMTDALACWFLKRQELRADGLVLLSNLRGQEDFARFVKQQRLYGLGDRSSLLRNDDVTLISCEMSNTSP